MLKPVPYRRFLLGTVVLAACSGTPTKSDATGGEGGSGGTGAPATGSGGTSSSGAGAGATGGSLPGSGGTSAGSGGSSGGSAGKANVGGALPGGAGAGGRAGSSGMVAGAGAGGAPGGGSGPSGGMGQTGGASSSGTPALHVDGPTIKDPNGNVVVLRGFDVPDLGTLYSDAGQNASGITARIDTALAAGLAGHVVRLAVYPRTCFNSMYPFYSPVPYPVGQAAPTGMHQDISEADYISKILKPAVDYLQSKNMYAIIDYHQIDDATGQSGTDAVTFWQTVAPAFASYDNVLFEPFNEPINTMSTWATFKTSVQSFIDAIRTAAPNNLIVVPSMSWDQHPGDAASSPPTGSNFVYTAHVYPGNWNDTFKQQVATAAAVAPVFFTEWGYILNGSDRNLGTMDANWGPDFQTLVDMNGASWSAWVADGSWTPNLFADKTLGSLSAYGMFTATWLASKNSGN
jgi:hypothetical protein